MEERQSRRKRRSEDGEKQGASTSAFNRISQSTAMRTRRVVLFLLGAWMGALLLVAMMAPVSFKTVDEMIWRKTENVAKMIQKAEVAPVRALMREQAGEANRRMFAMWGWMQFLLGTAVFGLLLFQSNVGKFVVGMAGLTWVVAGLMNFAILPLIAESVTKERFEMLHTVFAAFQLAVVLLVAVLLFLLFQRQRGESELGEESGERDRTI